MSWPEITEYCNKQSIARDHVLWELIEECWTQSVPQPSFLVPDYSDENEQYGYHAIEWEINKLQHLILEAYHTGLVKASLIGVSPKRKSGSVKEVVNFIKLVIPTEGD
jgi:hypothetical protein